MNFDDLCRQHGGARTKNGFEFPSVTKALKVAAEYSHAGAAPAIIADRNCTIVKGYDRLTIQTMGNEDCGWSRTDRKNYLTLIVPIKPEPIESVRVLVNEDGHQEGIFVQTEDGRRWLLKSEGSTIRVLMAMLSILRKDAEPIMGALHRDPWLRTCDPFRPEYPGGKVWNRGAPQLAYVPSPGLHPHWNRSFAQVGRKLTPYTRKAKIGNGSYYLMAWFASILRDPSSRLPYLFFYGDENCGKSMLWEAFALLVTGGVVKADRALTSEFNGELDGAILCAVEERDISRENVLPRIKDFTTGLTIAIRRLFSNQYQVPNYTHWLQCSNSRGACVVPPGDTRFTAIPVAKLRRETPKPELIEKLKAEAPAILHTLLTMTLPEPVGRLAVPAIDSPDKAAIQAQHLPAIAHKIIDLMDGRRRWAGTARELRDELGEGPATIAKLHSVIAGIAPFLSSQGIAAGFPEKRTSNGYTVEFTRNEIS